MERFVSGLSGDNNEFVTGEESFGAEVGDVPGNAGDRNALGRTKSPFLV